MRQSAPNDVKAFQTVPALDGVRAIAVILVMIYHLAEILPNHQPPLDGGFLGVDIFFVLSGFLITCVLLSEWQRTDTISLKSFYIRRICRLVPAYWLFVGVLFIAGRYVLTPLETDVTYGYGNFVSALTYITNWNSAFGSTSGHLNHTWSLAIEEQFYLLWPPCLILLLRRRRSMWQTVSVLAVAIIAVAAFRVWRADHGAVLSELYYATESRIDSLLSGCLAAFLFMSPTIRSRLIGSRHFTYLAWLALATGVFLVCWVREWEIETYRSYLLVFELSAATCILWCATHERSWSGRILSLWPIRFIGKISYGLYLWHWFSYRLGMDLFTDTSLQLATGVAMTFAIAASSYYFLELRFLKLKERLS